MMRCAFPHAFRQRIGRTQQDLNDLGLNGAFVPPATLLRLSL